MNIIKFPPKKFMQHLSEFQINEEKEKHKQELLAKLKGKKIAEMLQTTFNQLNEDMIKNEEYIPEAVNFSWNKNVNVFKLILCLFGLHSLYMTAQAIGYHKELIYHRECIRCKTRVSKIYEKKESTFDDLIDRLMISDYYEGFTFYQKIKNFIFCCYFNWHKWNKTVDENGILVKICIYCKTETKEKVIDIK